jgi:hypothetical protein
LITIKSEYLFDGFKNIFTFQHLIRGEIPCSFWNGWFGGHSLVIKDKRQNYNDKSIKIKVEKIRRIEKDEEEKWRRGDWGNKYMIKRS